MGNSCGREPKVKEDFLSMNPAKKETVKSLKVGSYRNKYEFMSVLGNGSIGKVRLFRDKQVHSMKYAIKTIKKENLRKNGVQSMIEDVDKLKSLMDHPNIVKYYETYTDSSYIHIVMEYIPADDLMKILAQRKFNKMNEGNIKQIITAICKALMFIHSQNIVHRDLKPENILFSIPGDFSSIKLIDFGISNIYQDLKKMKLLSIYYLAPEVFHGFYYFQTDVWSVGVILHLLLIGIPPFSGQNKEEAYQNIVKANYDQELLKKQGINESACDLISKCLIVQPEKRLSIEQILAHPWFAESNSSLSVTQSAEIDSKVLNSLKSFSTKNLFQKEVLYCLAKMSNDKEVVKLKNIFMEMDKDNTGTIEVEEVITAFKNLGIKIEDDDIQSIWTGMDFHTDGKVNYSEFLASTISSLNFFKEERLWSAFKCFVQDNKEYITVDSFLEALKLANIEINEGEINSFFSSVRAKKNKVDFETFKKLVQDTNLIE